MKPLFKQLQEILILDIETGDRLRAVDPARVASLAESIGSLGLRTPITVRSGEKDGEPCFYLVAGAHRLEAVRQSGSDYIEAYVFDGSADDAALWEIDENFARAELTDAQRADHHSRRKALLEKRGEALTRGGDRKSNSQTGSLKGYAKQAAMALGVGESSVLRDLRRANKIDPDILSDVSGTDLDKGVVLDELARTSQDQQRAKLAEIALRRQEAERIKKDAEAANRATDRVVSLTDAEPTLLELLTSFFEIPGKIEGYDFPPGTSAEQAAQGVALDAAADKNSLYSLRVSLDESDPDTAPIMALLDRVKLTPH